MRALLAVLVVALVAVPGAAASSSAPPPCSTSSLRIREVVGQGAAGTWILGFSYENTGTRACNARGYPGVTLYTPRGRRLPPVKRGGQPPTKPLILQPGQRAYGTVTYPDQQHRDVCRGVARARFYAPNSRRSVVIALRQTGRACGRLLLVYPLARSLHSAQR
jgi:Domain of unknown function (DUF4232)